MLGRMQMLTLTTEPWDWLGVAVALSLGIGAMVLAVYSERARDADPVLARVLLVYGLLFFVLGLCASFEECRAHIPLLR